MSNKIQLYSVDAPNGVKISTVLEELNIPYDIHIIDLSKGEQFSEEFTKINPNNKVPAIIDPNGADGKPITIFESGAILLYFAEKEGKLLPKDPIKKADTYSWLFWQMAGLGPMFGQFVHFFKFAPEKNEYSLERYTKESKRLLSVLDKQLEGKDYIIGDELTIADIAIHPWVDRFDLFTDIQEKFEYSNFKNVIAWKDRLREREAFQRGRNIYSNKTE